MEQRVLPLERIYNFRDYGGYASTLGGRVKSRVLWRSAQHGEASAADLAAVDALGLVAVVDLRGPSEREANPCRRPDGFAAQVFTYPEETAALALHTEAANGVVTLAEARAAMLRLYEGIAFRPHLIPMLCCHAMVLHRAEGPSLVHCVAGKDRTGFAVAMVLRLLGVHDDDVMADYLLTNTASRLEERIAAGAFRAIPRYASHDAATVRALWGVDEAYLATAFAAVKERFGTVETYFESVLEIDPAMQQRLRELYLES
jgi:protein tyrosine/serine phosphatase